MPHGCPHIITPDSSVAISVVCGVCDGTSTLNGRDCPECGGRGRLEIGMTLREMADVLLRIYCEPPPPSDADAPDPAVQSGIDHALRELGISAAYACHECGAPSPAACACRR